MKKEEKIRVVIKKVGQSPAIEEIENSLETMQNHLSLSFCQDEVKYKLGV